MNPNELNWLYYQATKMANICEIGCWKGRSTHALLSGCQGMITAIDTFEGSPGELETTHKEAKEKDIAAEFMINCGKFENLWPKRGTSIEISKKLEGKTFDMVFIDGDHAYEAVKADIEAWGPKTKKLLCGHDYNWPEVAQAVHDTLGMDKIRVYETIWYQEL
jgi:hypothetical protein